MPVIEVSLHTVFEALIVDVEVLVVEEVVVVVGVGIERHSQALEIIEVGKGVR